MADFSYQSLIGAMPQQPPPQSLWDGIQSPQTPGDNLSPLAMMLAKQRQQQDPRVFMREINPGATWGGRDQNAIQPNDVMQSRTFAQPPENI